MDNSESVVKKKTRPSTKLSKEKKELLKLAWSDVKEGRLNLYQAAKRHKIAYSTLRQWCQKDDVDHSLPSVGRPCYLGDILERKLMKWVLEAAKTGEFFIPL